eukprot:TRINITY_DN34918_c0_g1_i1.p1 TRINITY_DN34918_c0_g1~~TRINITY_DN34918_c0_g1_i1.p1  ORF type:complete len:183 (+),score=27.31 TRINITY_DN34918_c0_g1_i1:219-767(+)
MVHVEKQATRAAAELLADEEKTEAKRRAQSSKRKSKAKKHSKPQVHQESHLHNGSDADYSEHSGVEGADSGSCASFINRCSARLNKDGCSLIAADVDENIGRSEITQDLDVGPHGRPWDRSSCQSAPLSVFPLPHIWNFEIRNTFIHIPEASEHLQQRRASSAPPRFPAAVLYGNDVKESAC